MLAQRSSRPLFTWWLLVVFSIPSVYWLVLNHPLHSTWLWLAACSFGIFCYKRPFSGLLICLAVFPCFSFAPFTGWLVFEELDIVLLVFSTSVFLRQIIQPLALENSIQRANFSMNPIGVVLAVIVLVSGIFAMSNGVQQAGDFNYSFFTNYQTAENSLRTGKAYVLAPLFFLALIALGQSKPDAVIKAIVSGMTVGLFVAVAGCFYERILFTGLSDLSSDYRTTAWFWEMHLGGAALDAYLAVSIPFALAMWRYSVKFWQKALLLCFYLAVLYAALTTFSRAVYLAVPVAVGIFFFCSKEQFQKKALNIKQTILLVVFAVLVFVGTILIFSEGGYRASLGFAASLCLLWSYLQFPQYLSRKHYLIGVIASIVILTIQLKFNIYQYFPYPLYALLWLLSAAALLLLRFHPGNKMIAFVAVFSCLLSFNQVVIISAYWSEQHQFIWSLVAVLFVQLLSFLIFITMRNISSIFSLTTFAVGNCLLFAVWFVCALFSASSYLDERFATVDRDSLGRIRHWQQALEVQTIAGNIVNGAGMGRFTDATFKFGPAQERITTFNHVEEKMPSAGFNSFLYMKTGNHMHGYGEVLRITQQIAVPRGQVNLSFRIKSEKNTHLGAEICEKQLLYHGNCIRGSVRVKASKGWQPYSLQFETKKLDVLDLGMVRHLMFMLSTNNSDNSLFIDDLRLIDGNGQSLLQNGDFEQQMDFWFFTSDRNHMPYHLKNLFMHVLFEQGLVGLFALAALTAFVLARAVFGRSSQHPLSALISAAIAGLVVIGLFDSVIDAGRMAWMMLMLLLIGCSLEMAKIRKASFV